MKSYFGARRELWLIAANDNVPEYDWSWDVVMLLAHSSREERWDAAYLMEVV